MTDSPRWADVPDLIGFDPDNPPEGVYASWEVQVFFDPDHGLHNPHGAAWVDDTTVEYHLNGKQVTAEQHAEATKPKPKLEDFATRPLHNRGCNVERLPFTPLDGPSPCHHLCDCGLREAWLAAKEGDDQ